MRPAEIIGRTITNIFETRPSTVQEGISGPASYFDIVVELDGSDLYSLGAHEISIWTKNEELVPFDKPAWAVQNCFDVIGRKITRVIQKDCKEYYDGSLTLLLDNNIILEHQTTNGDQLFIAEFEEED